MKKYSGKSGRKPRKGATASEDSAPEDNKTDPLVVTLHFKKHVYDPSRRFVQ